MSSRLLVPPKGATPPTPSSPAFPTQESHFSRLIVAPVLFASFIISFFLIDRQTYGSMFSKDQDQLRKSSYPRSPADEYYRSNKRKLARQQMEEAFQLRSKVLAGLIVAGGIAVGLLGWGSQKLVTSGIWARFIPVVASKARPM